MRKVLIVCAALALCAAPAVAQQQSRDLAPAPAGAAAAPAPAAQADAPQPQKPAPSLFVSTDEIRRQVQAAAEDKRQAEAQVGSHNFLWIVAAIVIGVVIAALLLD